MGLRKSEKKKLCIGCKENVYNCGYLGVNECWNLSSAKVVQRKFVPLDMAPPWNMPGQRTLSCHRKAGYASIDAKRTN